MRKSIVLKLFLLTAGLCTLIVAGLFVAQTVFFQQYYVHQKVGNVQSALQAFAQETQTDSGDAQTAYAEEQLFYQQYNTWVIRLDAEGHLRFADNFETVVTLEGAENAPELAGQSITIPMYTVLNVEELRDDYPLKPHYIVTPGEPIAIEGLLINNRLYPQRIAKHRANLRDESQLENEALVRKELEVSQSSEDGDEFRNHYPSVLAFGTVTAVRTPEGAAESRYTNHLLLERIKAFQADLLFGDVSPTDEVILDYEENNIPYKVFITPTTDRSGDAGFQFAMTSLQPVDEVVGVARQYYGYVVTGTLLLVLLASYYYARRIARPLLRMNEATQKMANLDFSVRLPVATEDEIGSLSGSINELSGLLHSHIDRLEQDIAQEKRLEQTRKAFIAGVSHELKTPLSVIESCMYILKDKPDSRKREYYWTAMEDELGKMNLLISDMLELAKYESGTYNMALSRFRIDAVLERVCEKLAQDMANRRLRLHTRFVPAEVVANPLRIEQVVVNFLTNAIRYTPEGEQILVTTIEEPDTVKICIENKGARIPEEQLEKIWDRFYRGEQSRHRATGGTGLGLAISRQILELHGARYGAANTTDGVKFYFELSKLGAEDITAAEKDNP
ncbi:ATP-binding protein [Paenibacillus sp. 1P07SE]|uniref:sensor histidine kinase n=1 Tax=Paenibacillus sp. 1P07SE TaxID=3132209 RepID=UPI0039A5B459